MNDVGGPDLFGGLDQGGDSRVVPLGRVVEDVVAQLVQRPAADVLDAIDVGHVHLGAPGERRRLGVAVQAVWVLVHAYRLPFAVVDSLRLRVLGDEIVDHLTPGQVQEVEHVVRHVIGGDAEVLVAHQVDAPGELLPQRLRRPDVILQVLANHRGIGTVRAHAPLQLGARGHDPAGIAHQHEQLQVGKLGILEEVPGVVHAVSDRLDQPHGEDWADLRGNDKKNF